MRTYFLFLCIGLVSQVTLATEAETALGFTIPKAKEAFSESQPCVEPLATIRSQHGSILKHQRDATMRQGIRTEKHSFVGCIDCHVVPDESGNYPAIETPDHFCNSCHTHAAVHVDCFDCHATKPDITEPPIASQEHIERLGLTVSQLLDPHTSNQAGNLVVLSVVENSSIALQGVQQGDVITHINGKPCVGQGFRNMVNSLRNIAQELTLKQGTASRTVNIIK